MTFIERAFAELGKRREAEAERQGTALGKQMDADLFPRNIRVPGGYSPLGRIRGLYKSVWVRAMRELMGHSLEEVSSSSKASFCVAASMAKWKSPTFFVSDSVVRALMSTEFPKGVRIDEVLWPLPVATFFFPKGVFLDSGGRSVSTITWSVTEAGERVSYGALPVAFSPEKWAFNLVACVVGEGSDEGDLVYETTLLGETTLEMMETSPREVEMDQGTGRIVTSGPDVEKMGGFTVECAELVLKVVLLMGARPDFVEERREPSRAAKFKKGKQVQCELWEPNFIGRSYQIPGSGEVGRKIEGRSSPRLHLRRGFMRVQHYGEARSKHKMVFIGPTWVGADSKQGA